VLHQKDVIGSILSARFSTKSKLSLTNIVSGFVVRLVTKAIALGTLAKSKALSDRARSQSQLLLNVPHFAAALRSAAALALTAQQMRAADKAKPRAPLPLHFPTDPRKPLLTPVIDPDLLKQIQDDKQLRKELDVAEQKRREDLANSMLGVTSSILTALPALESLSPDTPASQTVDNPDVINADEDTSPAEQAAATDTTASPGKDVFEWATEDDDRVCPICQELEGEQWSADDPDMPTPGSDTHDSCRCRLDLVS